MARHMDRSDDEMIEMLAAEIRTAFFGYDETIPEWGAKVEDREKWLRLGRWVFEFGENFMATYGIVGELTEPEMIHLLPEANRN